MNEINKLFERFGGQSVEEWGRISGHPEEEHPNKGPQRSTKHLKKTLAPIGFPGNGPELSQTKQFMLVVRFNWHPIDGFVHPEKPRRAAERRDNKQQLLSELYITKALDCAMFACSRIN